MDENEQELMPRYEFDHPITLFGVTRSDLLLIAIGFVGVLTAATTVSTRQAFFVGFGGIIFIIALWVGLFLIRRFFQGGELIHWIAHWWIDRSLS